MRHRTRRTLAAALVDALVDEETRLKSNVIGRGKDQLDEKIIKYVKRKCFKMHPSDKESDMKKDWADCITSIDSKARNCKRKLKRKMANKKGSSELSLSTWITTYFNILIIMQMLIIIVLRVYYFTIFN